MRDHKYLGLAAGGLAIWMMTAADAIAAERVLLRYRGFSRTVNTADLATLANTGEAPDDLASLLRAAGQNPQSLQSWLATPISADPQLLDTTLNSWPGEWMLDQVGNAIHSASGEASRQALRSAIVLSSSDDSQITLLEVLEHYPTPEVVVEGDQIKNAYDQLSRFLNPLSIFTSP